MNEIHERCFELYFVIHTIALNIINKALISSLHAFSQL